MFNARPNRNGNDPTAVRKNYTDLLTQINKTIGAIHEVCNTNFHGRDYQLSGNPADDREADYSKMRPFALSLLALQDVIVETVNAIEKENN